MLPLSQCKHSAFHRSFTTVIFSFKIVPKAVINLAEKHVVMFCSAITTALGLGFN